MSANPAEADPGRLSQAKTRAAAGEEQPDDQAQTELSQSARDERLGPLAIARHRKDDGRALLLYARVEDLRA